MDHIDFDKGDGLVPAIVQDPDTREVLMLGYMNASALTQTRESGRVTFYSRSKNRLWTKGESSGNFLEFVEARVDCDRDTLLIMARPSGPVCHTGSDTCWGSRNIGKPSFLEKLEEVIAGRKELAEKKPESETSYVASLFQKGIAKIAPKVGEEAVETVIEAMASDRERFLEENADLLFHQLILLQAMGYRLEDIVGILEARHRPGR